jgi:hypothetical protein
VAANEPKELNVQIPKQTDLGRKIWVSTSLTNVLLLLQQRMTNHLFNKIKGDNDCKMQPQFTK